MPPNSEIEKLERRWKENPKGTVFAPYAEVLRKNGDVPLATEVLRQGLELHPDHIPGNIVLGRCQLDLGEDGPAEAAFTHVLDLDVENVIALKALGDITERQGRLMEASTWLERLISVDPSNDEARDQLARVLAMREAAAAAITRPVDVLVRPATVSAAPLPPPAPVIQPATPTALLSEEARGQIEEDAPSDDAAIDAVLDAFGPPLSVAQPSPSVPRDDEETVPSVPGLTRHSEAMPPPEVEPAEGNPVESAADPAPEPLEAFEPFEPFVVPARDLLIEPLEPVTLPPEDLDDGDVFYIASDEVAPIDLRPSGLTEFQAPDDSEALLDVTPGASEFHVPDGSSGLRDMAPDKSEFQVPNASEELTLSSAGATEYQSVSGADELLNLNATGSSEFQPPSGVDELLADASVRASAGQVILPEPATEPPPPVAPPKPWGGGVVTSGFAAIALMPTEEMPTGAQHDDPPPEVPLPEAATAFLPPFRPAPEAVAASDTAISETDVGVVDEDVDAIAAPLIAEMSSEPGMVELVDVGSDETFEEIPEPLTAAPASELRLIFPDDAEAVEGPRVHRISEDLVRPARTVQEPTSAEPEPVLTETMAELYVRQGHIAEALTVYRRMVEREPNDLRLAGRVRELEAMDHTGARRLSYIAMDTGGESVESFFRALVDARPMGAAMDSPPGPPELDDGSGAPTRPASDPLSLSAIFGEESAVAGPPGEPTTAPGATDAFSFDQFFGRPAPGSGSGSHPRGTGPGGEDLDQFQHWLKSLKR